jgi:tetratricopeptide (TPR) repeat protein
MTKDNILFSIIGILLGFIVGFMFANNVNQRQPAPRAQSMTTTANAPAPQSAELPPDHPAIPAEGVNEQGATATALQEAKQKADREPENFDAQVEAAKQFYAGRQYEQAIELLTRANQLRPDDYETMTALGNAYFDAGRFESAEKWYTTALAKNPDDVNVRTDLGLTFFFRKPPDMERAVKEFRASLKRDPNHEQTLINLIVVLTEKGDAKESQAMLAQLEKISPNNSALPKLRERVNGIVK